jgi:mRNA interferase MazF
VAGVLRGELWWANLPDPIGSGPGYRRPVVIVQSNPFNQPFLRTVIVAIVTSNVLWADSPSGVLLTTDVSGLAKPSVVNLTQLFTIDRTRLSEHIETLPPWVMESIDDALRMVLQL